MANVQIRPISVEIVYALPQAQTSIPLEVPPGTTARQAILRSEIAVIHPEIDLATLEAGIFGKRVELTTVLRDNDRVEICRRLLVDPKLARRKRARLKAGQKR